LIWTPTTTYVYLFHLLVVIPQLTNCYSLEASARCLVLPARSNVLLPAICEHSIFQTVVVDTLIYIHYSELCLWFAFKYSSHTHTYFSLTNNIFRSCTGTCIWIVSYNRYLFWKGCSQQQRSYFYTQGPFYLWSPF
jgi:hypothetical protein